MKPKQVTVHRQEARPPFLPAMLVLVPTNNIHGDAIAHIPMRDGRTISDYEVEIAKRLALAWNCVDGMLAEADRRYERYSRTRKASSKGYKPHGGHCGRSNFEGRREGAVSLDSQTEPDEPTTEEERDYYASALAAANDNINRLVIERNAWMAIAEELAKHIKAPETTMFCKDSVLADYEASRVAIARAKKGT